MPKSTISAFLVAQGVVLLAAAYSPAAFANLETAFVSALLILLGSMYSYRRLVRRNVDNGAALHLDDVVEKIDDPYDLYGETETVEPREERPLKEVIKEEKARLKASRATVKNTVKSAPAAMSLLRLVPYGVLVLGFIALKNNGVLDLRFYLPGLAVGIFTGYLVGKGIFGNVTT